MDIKQEIFEKAKVLYREELSAAAESSLYEMCISAYSELLQRLKDEVSIDLIHDQFVRAASVLSISLFIGLDCSSLDSFSAGNVTLKRRGSGSSRSAALSLRNQAELMMTGYLNDGGFCFGTVRV